MSKDVFTFKNPMMIISILFGALITIAGWVYTNDQKMLKTRDASIEKIIKDESAALGYTISNMRAEFGRTQEKFDAKQEMISMRINDLAVDMATIKATRK